MGGRVPGGERLAHMEGSPAFRGNLAAEAGRGSQYIPWEGKRGLSRAPLATMWLCLTSSIFMSDDSCRTSPLYQVEIFNSGFAHVIPWAWISFHFLSLISSVPRWKVLKPLPGGNSCSVKTKKPLSKLFVLLLQLYVSFLRRGIVLSFVCVLSVPRPVFLPRSICFINVTWPRSLWIGRTSLTKREMCDSLPPDFIKCYNHYLI